MTEIKIGIDLSSKDDATVACCFNIPLSDVTLVGVFTCTREHMLPVFEIDPTDIISVRAGPLSGAEASGDPCPTAVPGGKP